MLLLLLLLHLALHSLGHTPCHLRYQQQQQQEVEGVCLCFQRTQQQHQEDPQPIYQLKSLICIVAAAAWEALLQQQQDLRVSPVVPRVLWVASRVC